MALLLNQFREALANIEPDADADVAKNRHAEVRAVVDGSGDLAEWSPNTILIGSYSRHVSIRRINDVDVFCRLQDVHPDQSPKDVLERFLSVLQGSFGAARVKRQDRSIQVRFPGSDIYVDVVPARPASPHYEIPASMADGGGWQTTDPLELGSRSTRMNTAYNENYVPTVKLIRQTRRTLLSKRPGGLFFELMTYHAFDAGLTGQNVQTLYVNAIDHLARQLADVVSGGMVLGPALGTPLKVRVDPADFRQAADAFAQAA